MFLQLIRYDGFNLVLETQSDFADFLGGNRRWWHIVAASRKHWGAVSESNWSWQIPDPRDSISLWRCRLS